MTTLTRLWLCLLITSVAWGQSNCPLPPAIRPVPPGSNIFSDAQESDLGDIMAEELAPHISVVRDDSLNVHLRTIGRQLITYLPPTQFRYQFALVDLGEVNAFSLAGGRVYVARKLVALAHSDDELAGILAHELGHIVTHQSAIETTTALRQILGVTQVGDLNDIRDKYVHYLDSYRRKPIHLPGEEESQYDADQVAVFAMARAGFAPHAYADVWDRFQETRGHTGNWVSDLFGTTKPSQKRLREIMKNLGTLPKECAEMRPTSDLAAFQKWQSDVVGYRSTSLGESLPGLISKKELALPLRPDISNVRFSPDGKYILAQDDGGIHVLTREPLAPVFFIDAPDAEIAGFTPDSRSIVFNTYDLRVEAWDIQRKERTSVHEIVLRESCVQRLLSPNGKFLACLRSDWLLTLLDVESSQAVVTRDHLVSFSPYINWSMVYILLSEDRFAPLEMAFSPDGRYFLAGTADSGFYYDLSQKHELSLPGSIKRITHFSFAFLGSDRIVGIDYENAQKSPILRFPTGEKLAILPLSNTTHVRSPAHGDNVLLWPLREKPLGIMDIRKGQLFATFEHPAGDIFDHLLVSERVDGEIALFDVDKKQVVGSIRLAESRLGRLRAVIASPTFDLLAISTPSRGALWDLNHNVRFALTFGFYGAWFSDEHMAYVDFAKHEKMERVIGKLDTMGNSQSVLPLEKMSGFMVGPYFISQRREHPSSFERKDWTYEIQDYRTKATLWSRRFPHEVPKLSLCSRGILLEWPANTDAAKEELQKFPDLKAQVEKDDIFFELVDLHKGTVAGKLLVHTNRGSFRILSSYLDGDWAAFEIGGDRVLVYSLATAKKRCESLGWPQ